MSLTLRTLAPGDAPACYGLWYRAVHEGATRFYDAAQRQAWMPSANMPATFPARLARLQTWGALHDSHIIGFLGVEPDGHVDLAFVAPEWMGKGVAARLHGALIQWAETHAIARLHTEASHFFHRFLLRHGWRVITPETITRDGVAIERFRMEKLTGKTP